VRGLFVCALLAGCGFGVAATTGADDAGTDDAGPDAYVHEVPPRLIPGGGIDDAPIAQLLNVYAIDGATRKPIAGAAVSIGTITGTTDDAGLFVARGESLAGKATIAVTMAGYRAEVWIGVGGANVTLPLKPQPVVGVPRADLSGVFSTFNTNLPSLSGGHVRAGAVSYSQLDGAPEGANNINSMGSNRCQTGSCAFSIATRPGTIALIGTTSDVDTKNTPEPDDDTAVVQTYSYRTGITVADGASLNSQNLTQINPNQLVNVTIDYGTPPPGFTVAVGSLGIDLPVEGTLYLGQLTNINAATIKAPPLSLFAGSTYRFLGFAGANGGLSVLYKRGVAASPIMLGIWLGTPTLLAASRTDAMWTAPTDATYSGALYRQPGVAEVLEVLSFDGTQSATLPSAITLPTAALGVQALAYRAGYDLTSFSFAEDGTLLEAGAAGASVAVP
jgi:hypothetical protein